MGVAVHSFISPYSLLMSVLWFSAFVLLSLVMRKLRFPVKFSVAPLMVLLILSFFRIFFIFDLPGSTIILSENFFPAIVNFSVYEIIPHRVFGMTVNVINTFLAVWVIVTIVLAAKCLLLYKRQYKAIMLLTSFCPRDRDAEEMLAEIVGSKKHLCVYRTLIDMPFTAGFKPYIFLPENIDFPPDELRVVLEHEWKHCRDRDYIMSIVTNAICVFFWWNPLVYVLKRNVHFAVELKCDYFAISDKDYDHYVNSVYRLDGLLDPKGKYTSKDKPVGEHTFDSDSDREKALVLHKDAHSHSKRILANMCFCVVMGILFLSSYTFVFQPIFWESPDVSTSADTFSEWNYEAYKADENFIVDNEDGTFHSILTGYM